MCSVQFVVGSVKRSLCLSSLLCYLVQAAIETVPLDTQHNTTLHNTTQHNITQHNTTQHNTTHHNTTQHNTTQHYTTQHNITQHNTVGCAKKRSTCLFTRLESLAWSQQGFWQLSCRRNCSLWNLSFDGEIRGLGPLCLLVWMIAICREQREDGLVYIHL